MTNSERMGEQPIFTTKAHVFQIDPKTKKNWVPASNSSITVSYYYDGTRNTYRIISVDGSKAIINSTITPNMTFTKTSQKFGQWSDPRANTVYGLGFSSEVELSQFIEKFREVKELTRQAESQTNGSTSEDQTSPISAPSAMRNIHTRSGSMSSVGSDTSNNDRRTSSSSLPIAESQLKYENDRLKIALAQSSANAKKWEVELQTLKNNNARLTTALQESTANVEEWKKQLAAYKEESARLKKRVLEMEQGQSSHSETKVFEQQIEEMSSRLEQLELEKKSKTEESERLSIRLHEMSLKESQSAQYADRIKMLEKDNVSLKERIKELDIEKDMLESKISRDTDDMLALQDSIQGKMSELGHLQEKMSTMLKQTADEHIMENSAL